MQQFAADGVCDVLYYEAGFSNLFGNFSVMLGILI